jgi:hypothetical protein
MDTHELAEKLAGLPKMEVIIQDARGGEYSPEAVFVATRRVISKRGIPRLLIPEDQREEYEDGGDKAQVLAAPVFVLSEDA